MRDRGEALHQLTREGRWNDMAGIIDDAMLDTFVPAAPYAEIADVIDAWYAGLASSVTFPVPQETADEGPAKRAIRRLQGRD